MIARVLWLHMLRAGGRWSCAELRSTFPAASKKNVEMALERMAKAGFIRRFDKSIKGDRVTFGVVKDCKVPRGVALNELAAVGVIREAA